MNNPTPVPSKDVSREWRCFHCDDVFHTEVDARNHFGSDQCSEPACRIKVAGESALLQALRNAEDQLAQYRNDDSDVLRAMWSAQADHATALRCEEEKGYERGLRDAKEHPETLGLQRASHEPRATRCGCPDLDPDWPNSLGEPRGPTLCVLYPKCKCGEKDKRAAQPPCDDLKEATRLLHVVNAWFWRSSDDPDSARVDPLYPARGTNCSKAPLFAAIRALLDRYPYGGATSTKPASRLLVDPDRPGHEVSICTSCHQPDCECSTPGGRSDDR